MDTVPLIGRRHELDVLDGELRLAREGSRLVIVTGDAGVGKTRLLREFAARGRGRAIVLVGRGSPLSSTIPYSVLAEAIESHLRTLEAGTVRALVGDRSAELAGVLPSVVSATGGAALTRLGTFEGIARLLTGLAAEERPVVLALDDLHQADPSTWEVIAYLGRNPLPASVLIVGTVRSEAVATSEELASTLTALVKDGLALELRLAPLGADDLEVLAERELGAEAADAELVEWLVERSRGNPLYAVALLDELRDDPTRRIVPSSVRERVRIAVNELPEETAETLRLASVLGHSFQLRTVAMVGGARSEAALDDLVRRGLLVLREEEAAPWFDFAHPLVQEAVYETMAPGVRRALHERVAASSANESLGVRAYHVARSALPGDEAAIELLRRAARQAEAASSHREALSYLKAALDLVTVDDDAARIEFLDEIMWQAAEASDHTIGIPAARELLALSAGDARAEASARMRLASFLATGAADLTAAEAEIQRAIATLARLGDDDLLAAATNELGWINAMRGDFRSQEARCREVVEVAERTGNDELLLRALGPLAHALGLRGAFEEADAVGERCVGLATATGDPGQIGWNTGVIALDLACAGRFAEAAASLDALLEPGGSPSDVAYDNRAFVNWFIGRWELVLADVEVVGAMHPTSPSSHSAWSMSIGAAVQAWGGASAAADRLLAQAARVYADRDVYYFSSVHGWAAGLAAAARGEAAAAAAITLHAVEWLDHCGLTAMNSLFIPDLVEALTAADELTAAREWAARAQAVAGELRTPFASAAADHAEGIVRSAADPLRRAEGAYEELGLPFQRARALERLAEADGAARVEALSEAARLYARLPAPAAAERVKDALRRGGAAGRRAAQRVGELTPREREVAALARRGLPTSEIAGRLHLSERTVESHLARIYAKLGVAGRRELGGR